MSLNMTGVKRAMLNTRHLPDGRRRCSRCGIYKDLGEFSGSSAYCKPCYKAYRQPKRNQQKAISKEKKQARHEAKMLRIANGEEPRAHYTYGSFMGKSTERKEQVLALKAQGLTYQQIGEQLGISRQRAQQIASVSFIERRLITLLDGEHCRICDDASKDEARLDIHHIRYSGSVMDAITLCQPCHRRFEAICRELGIEQLDRPVAELFPEPSAVAEVVGQEVSEA